MRTLLRFVGLMILTPLLWACGGCPAPGEEAAPTIEREQDERAKATLSPTPRPARPEALPEPSEWSVLIEGGPQAVRIGGRVVHSVTRPDPLREQPPAIVIQMMPEPNDASERAGSMEIRGLFSDEPKAGPLTVLRVDVTAPAFGLRCTEAGRFDVILDTLTNSQVEGSFEGAIACSDGETYEVSGRFRD